MNTYAVVAAKMSTLLAFVTRASVKEKADVNSMVRTNRAKDFLTKYRAKIEAVGRSEDSTVLMIFATAMRLVSS